jgi:creatinine amidohydrolase
MRRPSAWHAWAWTDFAALEEKPRWVVVLPLHGFRSAADDAPLDAEGELLAALTAAAFGPENAEQVLVLPPVHFAAGAADACAFAVPADLALAQLEEICLSVRAAGFSRVVFLNASPHNEGLCDTAARDLRVEHALQTFCIHLSALGLSAGDVADPCALGEAALALGGLIQEIRARPPLQDDAAPVVPAGRPQARPDTPAATVTGIPRAPATAGLELLSRDYRERYLPAFSRRRIAGLPGKAQSIVVVTTGAIEQHGPHLPVAVDARLGQVWLARALAHLPPEYPCYVAPALTVGKSNEHTGFPGTLSLSRRTVHQLLRAVARQVASWGFTRLAVLNTHGGNTPVLSYVLPELEREFGLRVARLAPDVDCDVSEQERTYGFHAGEVETAWMLAIAPAAVRMEAACAAYPARLDSPGQLRPEAAPSTFAWATRDLSPTGVMGDATRATPENGRRWLERGAEAYARALRQFLEER